MAASHRTEARLHLEAVPRTEAFLRTNGTRDRFGRSPPDLSKEHLRELAVHFNKRGKRLQ